MHDDARGGPASRPSVGSHLARACGLALLLATAAQSAGAATPGPEQGPAQACLKSYDDSQPLRQAGRLVAARQELLRCSQEICPSAVKSDCLPWLAEVERSLPSIVVAAKDTHGQDTANVRVLIDAALAAPTLDGRPIALDPGTHHLRFELAGAPAIEQDIVVQVGVKNRPVEVSFGPKAPGSGSLGGAAGPAAGEPSAERGEPVAGYVLTGFGVLGLGSFALFGLLGKGEADTYQETCAPTKTCNEDDVAATRTKLIVADVSLGVGVAALGVGIALILYNKLSDPDQAAPSARIDFGPLPGGAAGAFALPF